MPDETIKTLQGVTKEYLDIVAEINRLSARKAELVETMVANGFADHTSGHLNLQNGSEIVMSFTKSAKVLQTEFSRMRQHLPQLLVKQCFVPEYKLDKEAYNKLSDKQKHLLAPCLQFRENAPRITIKCVPVVEEEPEIAPAM